MNEKSKAFELIEFVWNNEKTDSYLRVNIAMYEAVKLAIISQMKFNKTSRDYQLLKKLLDEGKEIVCFTDFPIDNRIFRDVCKARKIGEGRYSVTCRGCEYASFWENHNYKWTFEDEMRMANIEFIEPNI